MSITAAGEEGLISGGFSAAAFLSLFVATSCSRKPNQPPPQYFSRKGERGDSHLFHLIRSR